MTPDELLKHAGYIWLAAGVMFVLLEAIGCTGIGLMFAGLGALMVGSAIQGGLIAPDNHVMQFTVFFFAAVIWALLLWKPMQKFRISKHGGEYNNIVGETAYVGSNGLTKQAGGEVTWSGTIMKAQLVKNARTDMLEAGAQVTIVEVAGATLIVTPKD